MDECQQKKVYENGQETQGSLKETGMERIPLGFTKKTYKTYQSRKFFSERD